MRWLIDYWSRTLAGLGMFFAWRWWWAFALCWIAMSVLVGWLYQIDEIWLAVVLAILMSATWLIVFIAFDAFPMVTLTIASVPGMILGMRVGGASYEEAWAEVRTWFRRNP